MIGLNAWTDWLLALKRVLGGSIMLISPKRAWEREQQEQVDADYERLDDGGDSVNDRVGDSECEVIDMPLWVAWAVAAGGSADTHEIELDLEPYVAE